MEREIKFRGKKINSGEWVIGDLIINRPTQSFRIMHDGALVKHGNNTADGLHCFSGYVYEVEKNTVGQFTGLLDKNGREIYEGDISKIKINIQGGRSVESINKVIYDKGAFHYEDIKAKRSIPMFGVGYACEVEMIGNIFDNPELIEL